VRSGPEASVVQSASLVAGHTLVDSALRSIDLGSWVGRRPEEIASTELGAWFAHPDATPHGGESVGAFVDRVHTCLVDLARQSASLVVAAKPVVQAAVALDRGLGAAGFFTVDVCPASTWTVDISIRG
jgi:broad specificity phosphatase PhoE